MPLAALPSVEELQQQLTICRNEIANLRTKLRAMSAQFNRQCKEILQALEVRSGSTETLPNQPRDCESANSNSFTFQPIGYVHTAFPFKNGTPPLEGLDKFSHVWLLSVFDRNTRKEGSREFAYRSKVQPPRLGGQTWGVLASRSPHRPCPVGLTLARLHSVQGSVLHLSGVDLVDGTPILDVKPYLPQYDSPPAGDLGRDARHSMGPLDRRGRHTGTRALECLLKADPRSIHRKDNCSDRLYYCVLDSIHVTAWFDEGRAEVLKVRPRAEGERGEPADTC
ncbi:hypothetical protein MTO96_004272 [Rhipicephalus appendiculatus]